MSKSIALPTLADIDYKEILHNKLYRKAPYFFICLNEENENFNQTQIEKFCGTAQLSDVFILIRAIACLYYDDIIFFTDYFNSS